MLDINFECIIVRCSIEVNKLWWSVSRGGGEFEKKYSLNIWFNYLFIKIQMYKIIIWRKYS